MQEPEPQPMRTSISAQDSSYALYARVDRGGGSFGGNRSHTTTDDRVTGYIRDGSLRLRHPASLLSVFLACGDNQLFISQCNATDRFAQLERRQARPPAGSRGQGAEDEAGKT